jgi:hypothetical protein
MCHLELLTKMEHQFDWYHRKGICGRIKWLGESDPPLQNGVKRIKS